LLTLSILYFSMWRNHW